MSAVLTEVYCTVQFEAIHSWPDCPHGEVSYLRDLHRHVFHIKAYKKVSHNDRDVEFIMLKHGIENYLNAHYPDKNFGAKSCEMIGRELMTAFGLSKVDVSEDDENGAVLTGLAERLF